MSADVLSLTRATDDRRRARLLYFQHWRVVDIAELLGRPRTTIDAWRVRDKWDDTPAIKRCEEAVEAKFVALVNKDAKTGADVRDIDLLGRQIERLARVRRYEEPGGHEGDLNPKVANRNAKPKKRARRNALTDEQIEALRADFHASNFAYQELWWSQLSQRVRMILKSRQIGATFYFAREAMLDAALTGDNQIFLSASKAQADMFRAYIVDWVFAVTGVELKGNKSFIQLGHNDAKLYFLATNKATAQSYHGHLYFDEFFWVGQFEKLNTAASGMASHAKWRKTYFSTPSSILHEAYPFWTGDDKNARLADADKLVFDLSKEALLGGVVGPDGVWRNRIDVFDAERQGCNLFDIAQLQREYAPDQFANLYGCEFVDDAEAVFPMSVLKRCFVDAGVAWTDVDPLGRRRFPGKVAIGYDPQESSTGDNAGLVVLAMPERAGGKFRLLERVQFRGRDFEAQAAEIRRLGLRYDIEWIGIDGQGVGAGVLQLVRRFFPRVHDFRYSAELKNMLVLKARNVIERGRLEIDVRMVDVASHFMMIRRSLTGSEKRLTYTAGRTKGAGHADLAWATMMALMVEPIDGKAKRRGFVEIYDD